MLPAVNAATLVPKTGPTAEGSSVLQTAENNDENGLTGQISSSNDTITANSNIVGNPDGNCTMATTTTTATNTPQYCHFFLTGFCRFGNLCRFSHDLTNMPFVNNNVVIDGPSTSSTISKIRADAPTFVPGRISVDLSRLLNPILSSPSLKDRSASGDVPSDDLGSEQAQEIDPVFPFPAAQTWASVVGGPMYAIGPNPALENEVCPFEAPCPHGIACQYPVHLELCEMCDQYCLHPTDQEQRRKHNKECLQQHEQAMELSFAIARSKDKTCGICFDIIMEKSGREKRFGILPNCNHIFCLECIRKWRQAKQFEHKITRSCPECRIASDFVCPSAFWVETKEEKDKLLNDYRAALGTKDCKYFKKGQGMCPFGNKCFYKHALPDGKLVDVGLPKRARKVFLWEYVDQRDYHWLDGNSSDSDDSDFDEADFLSDH